MCKKWRFKGSSLTSLCKCVLRHFNLFLSHVTSFAVIFPLFIRFYLLINSLPFKVFIAGPKIGTIIQSVGNGSKIGIRRKKSHSQIFCSFLYTYTNIAVSGILSTSSISLKLRETLLFASGSTCISARLRIVVVDVMFVVVVVIGRPQRVDDLFGSLYCISHFIPLLRHLLESLKSSSIQSWVVLVHKFSVNLNFSFLPCSLGQFPCSGCFASSCDQSSLVFSSKSSSS